VIILVENLFLGLVNQMIPNEKDALAQLKTLLLERFHFATLKMAITKTRSYDSALMAIDHFFNLLENNSGRLSDSEYAELDKKICILHLMCLDKSDRWNAYLQFFDIYLKTKKYKSSCYVEPRKSHKEPYLYIDSSNKTQVHFLYDEKMRYELIQRKVTKSLKSNKLGNLQHKKQIELTDFEIEQRFNDALDWLNRMNNEYARRNL